MTFTTENPLPSAKVGQDYRITFSVSGGAGPYRLAAVTTPKGLTLDPFFGTLSGTPTAAGPVEFAVQATDENGCSVIGIFVISVSCPEITLSSSLPAEIRR